MLTSPRCPVRCCGAARARPPARAPRRGPKRTLGREHRAHAPAGRAGRRGAPGRGFLAVHGEDVGGVVVDDQRAGHLVGEGGLPVAAQLRAPDQPHQVGPSVVLDHLAFALDELVRGARRGVALLAEESPLAGLGRHRAVLEPVGVLAHVQPGAAQHDGALGHHHASGEHACLLELIVAQCVGLDVHRLVAIGFFRPGPAPRRMPWTPAEEGWGGVWVS